MKTLIKRRVLRRLILVFTVCLCPTKRTLGLYGLSHDCVVVDSVFVFASIGCALFVWSLFGYVVLSVFSSFVIISLKT